MKREDFVFVIGFQGEQAIVDGQSKKRYAKLNTRELTDKGLFRAALRSAIFSDDEGEADYLVNAFSKASGTPLGGLEDLKKLLGVHQTADVRFKAKVV